jgi:hypothetical protein
MAFSKVTIMDKSSKKDKNPEEQTSGGFEIIDNKGSSHNIPATKNLRRHEIIARI